MISAINGGKLNDSEKININGLLYWKNIWDLILAWSASAITKKWRAYLQNLIVSTVGTEQYFNNAKMSKIAFEHARNSCGASKTWMKNKTAEALRWQNTCSKRWLKMQQRLRKNIWVHFQKAILMTETTVYNLGLQDEVRGGVVWIETLLLFLQ